MATKRNLSKLADKVKKAAGMKLKETATKRNPSSGVGYTATATNRKTGAKTTSSGTLKKVSANEFKSNGLMKETATKRSSIGKTIGTGKKITPSVNRGAKTATGAYKTDRRLYEQKKKRY